jgi:hypothetical protein
MTIAIPGIVFARGAISMVARCRLRKGLSPPPTPDPDDPPTPLACSAAQYGSCSATHPDTIVSNYDRPPGTWWPDCDFCATPPCISSHKGSATQSFEDLPPDTIVSNYDRPPDCDFCATPPCISSHKGSATQSFEDLPPDTIVSNYDRPPDCDFCGPPPDCDFCGPPPDVCGPPVALRRSARIRDANRRRRRLRRSGPDEYWSSNSKARRMQYLLAIPPAKGMI